METAFFLRLWLMLHLEKLNTLLTIMKYRGEIFPSIDKEHNEQLHNFKTMTLRKRINVTQENLCQTVDSIHITSAQEQVFEDQGGKK